MTVVLTRRQPYEDTDTQGGCHVTVETAIGVTQLQAMEH